MFVVSETEADAIRATFVQQGELAAAIGHVPSARVTPQDIESNIVRCER